MICFSLDFVGLSEIICRHLYVHVFFLLLFVLFVKRSLAFLGFLRELLEVHGETSAWL